MFIQYPVKAVIANFEIEVVDNSDILIKDTNKATNNTFLIYSGEFAPFLELVKFAEGIVKMEQDR